MVVFLIGFMGSGKSRKGKELAALLKWPFIDIDLEITKQSGLSINAYFHQMGEADFRNYETKILQSYLYPENCIVAVGGGLPCFNDNINWMKDKGLTVYLKMDPAALVTRLVNRSKRPLIKDLNDAELLLYIKNKLAERALYYEQAEIILNGLDLSSHTLHKALFAE